MPIPAITQELAVKDDLQLPEITVKTNEPVLECAQKAIQGIATTQATISLEKKEVTVYTLKSSSMASAFLHDLYLPEIRRRNDKAAKDLAEREDLYKQLDSYSKLASTIFESTQKKNETYDFASSEQAKDLLDTASDNGLVEKGKYKFTLQELQVLENKLKTECEHLPQKAQNKMQLLQALLSDITEINRITSKAVEMEDSASKNIIRRMN